MLKRIEEDWAPVEPEPAADEELVREFVAGDDNAFSTLVERHSPKMHQWASVHARGLEDSEEIVQEALLNAARHLNTFRFEAKVSTWLYRLVRNSAVNYYRNKEFILESYDEQESAAELFMRSWGHDPFEGWEERIDVLTCLRTLPPSTLAVLYNTDVLGLSLRDTAAEMEMGRKKVTRLRDMGHQAFRDSYLAGDAESMEDSHHVHSGTGNAGGASGAGSAGGAGGASGAGGAGSAGRPAYRRGPAVHSRACVTPRGHAPTRMQPRIAKQPRAREHPTARAHPTAREHPTAGEYPRVG